MRCIKRGAGDRLAYKVSELQEKMCSCWYLVHLVHQSTSVDIWSPVSVCADEPRPAPARHQSARVRSYRHIYQLQSVDSRASVRVSYEEILICCHVIPHRGRGHAGVQHHGIHPGVQEHWSWWKRLRPSAISASIITDSSSSSVKFQANVNILPQTHWPQSCSSIISSDSGKLIF